MKITVIFISLIAAICFGAVGSEYNFAGTGALCFTSDNTGSNEICLPVAPIVLSDDFIGGRTSISGATESVTTSTWVKMLTASGPETVGIAADGTNGYVTIALTSAAVPQQATLYAGDQQVWEMGQGLVFQARVNFSVLPTGTVEAYIGMNGATSSAGSAYRCNFRLTGSGLIYCETDDNSTDSGLITSAVTVVANQWVILTIDASDASDVKFYINGNRVASGTTFAYEDTTNLQPYFSLCKSTAGVSTVGTMNVDYVRVFQNRM